MTAETNTKSTEAAAKKSTQVSTTLPGEYHHALDEYAWDNRKKMTQVVREALDMYTAAKGINVTGEPAPESKDAKPASK